MDGDGPMMSFVREATSDHDFDALFRAEGQGVYRTMYAYTAGRRDIAEDATAEAFARAIAHAGTIREPLRWIYRVAFRVAADELKRDREISVAVDQGVAPPELIGLMDALRQLSPNQRAAVVLRHVVDLDVHEVAQRMGVATPTVRVHLHRARGKLRELLGDEEVD